jgi:leader peptidase (prepilin peptidase)/N-methyltransferase
MDYLLVKDICRALLIMALLYLAYIDLLTFRLPNKMTIPMIVFGLMINATAQINTFSGLAFASFRNSLAGVVFAFLLFWLLNQLYHRLTNQHGIGQGDIKLLAGLGAWLGANALPSILLIACIGGLIGGLIWLSVQKKTLRSAFPFGPFLAIAGIIGLLWPQILQFFILNTPTSVS